jgi:hypothetical protein
MKNGLVSACLSLFCALGVGCGGVPQEGEEDMQPIMSVDSTTPQDSAAHKDEPPNVIDDDNAPEEVHTEDPYDELVYNGACGSGYRVIDSHSLIGGTVYLTYNSGTGRNCVVTIRSTPGSRLWMCANVSRARAPWIQDCGSYTTYAGPVYVAARNACIDWGGSIGNSSYYEYNTHCR